MFLPAIDIDTMRLLLPQYALKGKRYSCPSCHNELIFRAGEKNRPHFSHKTVMNCSYTEHPSESEIHLAAKHMLCDHLKYGGSFTATFECKCPPIEIYLKEGERIYTEYRHHGIIPDIAIVKNDVLIACIEIFHTHRQSNRPEPWFEFRATDIIQCTNSQLKDCRTDRMCKCQNPCRGKCFEQSESGKYIKNKWSTCDCELKPCKQCGNCFPEWVLLCFQNKCMQCTVGSYTEVMQKGKAKRKGNARRRRPKKNDFCGLCKQKGKLVKFKNCSHYCCENCYSKKTTPCNWCSKIIK